MNNYEILQVSENATDEEIKEAYRALKAKYNEDRWLEGEAGNEAARMLGKIDTAYEEIMRERRERQRSASDDPFKEVAELIRAGQIAEAQEKLDAFNERSAEWHYLQSVVFYKKNWINESKKQLEIAMQLDGANQKYRDAYEKLRARADYREQSGGAPAGNAAPMPDEQMGGNWCTSLWNTCACMSWLWCCCNGCR